MTNFFIFSGKKIGKFWQIFIIITQKQKKTPQKLPYSKGVTKHKNWWNFYFLKIPWYLVSITRKKMIQGILFMDVSFSKMPCKIFNERSPKLHVRCYSSKIFIMDTVPFTYIANSLWLWKLSKEDRLFAIYEGTTHSHECMSPHEPRA